MPWLGHDPRQGLLERPDALDRDHRRDRVAVLGVEPLDRVGHGVEAAGHAHAHGQAEREVGVVDDHLGQDPRPAHRGLEAILGLAEDRRDLRAGIGRGHHDLRGVVAVRDGLAQPDGRPAAEGDDAIGPIAVT